MNGQYPQEIEVKLVTRGREEAGVLLETLLVERGRCEERLAASGRDDPLKTLTGLSAFDRAIARTREMMQRMDDLLRELQVAEASLDGAAAAGVEHSTSP